ncbi:N/A [soil metagenome]
MSSEVHGLDGCRVAVTRPEAGGDVLSELLRAEGAIPVAVPLIAIRPPADAGPLRAALAELDDFDWVVFTSANAVQSVGAVLEATGRSGAAGGSRVAAVGPATARAVVDVLGWEVDVVPERYAGDAVVAAMSACAPVAQRRVLWPRAETAREALPRDLAAAGARVDAPVAYRTAPLPNAAREIADLLETGALHAIILTSPSAVRCLAAARPRTNRATFCSMGSSTAEAMRRHGLPVHVEPDQHTIPALVDALRVYLDRLK